MILKLTLSVILTLAYLSPDDIRNIKTSRHVQIPGTSFFIIPPPGFIQASHFHGFQQPETGSSILVAEIPGPFSESSKGFTDEGFRTQGVVLKNKEGLLVNGLTGLLLTLEQTANGIVFTKYVLAFGDNKATTMVNGAFPKEMTRLGVQILTSLRSIVKDTEPNVDVEASSPFTIDTRGTKMNIGGSISGTLMYTVDGKVPTQSSDKTSFMVGHSLAIPASPDKKQVALHRMRTLPFSNMEIAETNVSEILIDGLSGYEIIGVGFSKTNGTEAAVYQVMLFTDSGYYILLGIAEADRTQNLAMFKKLARSFTRK